MTKKTGILIGFILLKFLLQYLLHNPNYDLQRDEYLHLDQANHLAWGFLSVPPVTSWFAWLIKILGNGIFWIRFIPALFGALTMLIVWKTIEELKGNLFALILGATCVIFSALLRVNFLFQPNSFDVLAWTAFYYTLIKYINTQNTKWLFMAALVVAFGFLNKYNILFLLIGIFPAILLSAQRKVFTRKDLYYAIILGIIIISPNIYWQYKNGFPVFHHMKLLAETQLVNVNRLDFIKEQFLFFIGAIPVIVASLYALLFYKPFKKFRLFFATFFITLIVFIYFKAKGYYALGLYPIYLAFGATYIGNLLSTGWRKYLQPILIAIPILFYVLLFNIVFTVRAPNYYVENKSKFQEIGLLRWEDGEEHALPQDFADMLGWKELAHKVDSTYDKLPNKNQTVIMCDNYGQAGAINYYTKNKNVNAISFNADYINWFNLPDTTINFIRVVEFDDSVAEFKNLSPYFAQSFIADSITNPHAREYKTTIMVFSNPKIDVNKKLEEEVVSKKKYD